MRLRFETFCSLLGLLSSTDDVSSKLLRIEHENEIPTMSHGWIQPGVGPSQTFLQYKPVH